eukprot:gnl/MRDRNA2_/MRDRNA2_91838_c0_seq1.p1 gnl/MRDRNA2_/MRDRNA2_91838_c0~~gnl/MRDRNA2_/MRDRNA2_91838_c0_seq1.p1  ORF type:complete len:414 (+),score=81.26 gnl/MRDRNA2_/MRDRNA2_91838_c0_seq1:147-1388(+)
MVPAPTYLNRQLRNTRFCTFFQQTGSCKYGAKCGFAHHERDLQKSPDLTKTRMCPKVRCQDANCPFAHTGDELRSTDFYFKTSLCTWYAAGKCRNGTNCHFAHGEKELRSAPGSEEAQPQKCKKGKAEKAEKNTKNAAKEKDISQSIAEKQSKTQKSDKEKASKSKAVKMDQPSKFIVPQGFPETDDFAVPQYEAPQQPMFIQPQSCLSSQPSSGFSTLPQARSLEHFAAPAPSMDYYGLSQLLSGYHCNNLAPMIDAQQQALLSQLGPWLTEPQSASAHAGLNFNHGLSGNHLVPPGLEQHAVPNGSKSWEITQLAEHIKMLGEQVSELQQSMTLNAQSSQALKSEHVSETTKSGSSQGSLPSGDVDSVSPPGSPDECHPDEVHAEVARLSLALQRFDSFRFVDAQGGNRYQ